MAIGFFYLSIFWGPEFAPAAHACSCFLSHTVCSYFVARGKMCPGCKHCSMKERVPGPSLSQFWKWIFFFLCSFLNCELLLHIIANYSLKIDFIFSNFA